MSEKNEPSLVVVNEESQTTPSQDGEACTVTNNITLAEPADEPVNRTRRAFYIFAVTAFSLVISSLYVGLGMDSKIVEHFVLGLLDLVEIIAIVYVSAGVIDRSEILKKVGEAMNNRPSRRRGNGEN